MIILDYLCQFKQFHLTSPVFGHEEEKVRESQHFIKGKSIQFLHITILYGQNLLLSMYVLKQQLSIYMFKLQKLKVKAKFSLLCELSIKYLYISVFSTFWNIFSKLYFIQHFGNMALLRPPAVAKYSGSFVPGLTARRHTKANGNALSTQNLYL